MVDFGEYFLIIKIDSLILSLQAGISRDKVIPLYGRGGEGKDPREKVPPRPQVSHGSNKWPPRPQVGQ